MSDWRLFGQEKHLSKATLYPVSFPGFWETAYREKNGFMKGLFVAQNGLLQKQTVGTNSLKEIRYNTFGTSIACFAGRKPWQIRYVNSIVPKI